MKTPFSKVSAAFFCFSCLFACGLIEPYRDLEITILTRVQYVDVMLFDMPDSAKIFNGTYDLTYHAEGTLHLSKIPDGTYWLRVEDSRHAAHSVDTLFVYTGKKSVTLEL